MAHNIVGEGNARGCTLCGRDMAYLDVWRNAETDALPPCPNAAQSQQGKSNLLYLLYIVS